MNQCAILPLWRAISVCKTRGNLDKFSGNSMLRNDSNARKVLYTCREVTPGCVCKLHSDLMFFSRPSRPTSCSTPGDLCVHREEKQRIVIISSNVSIQSQLPHFPHVTHTSYSLVTMACQLIADSGRPQHTPTSSLFREQTLDLATGVSRSRVREFGTVYPPHCGSLTLNLEFEHFKRLLKAFLFGETVAY